MKTISCYGPACRIAPMFPAFSEISLDDRDDIVRRLEAAHAEHSEMSFASLFIWRRKFPTSWALYDRWLLLLERRQDGTSCFLDPVGDGVCPDLIYQMLEWLREECGEEDASLESSNSGLIGLLDRKTFHVEPIPEYFDYVYSRKRLSELSGRGLSSKRNHIRRLLRNNNYHAEPLRAEFLPDCRRVVSEWLDRRRDRLDRFIMDECEAIHEALENFRRLPVEGSVIFVGDRIEAFSISERLNRDTQAVLAEKATNRFPGLYPVLIQQSAISYCPDIKWINRMGDMGCSGLRLSKRSWQPDHMIKKYRVRLRRRD